MHIKNLFKTFLCFISAKKASRTCSVQDFVINCIITIVKKGTEDRNAVLAFLAALFRVDLLRLNERQRKKAEQLAENIIVSFLLITEKTSCFMQNETGSICAVDLTNALFEAYDYFVFFENYQNNDILTYEYLDFDIKNKIRDSLSLFLVEEAGFHPIEMLKFYTQRYQSHYFYKEFLEAKAEIIKKRKSNV